MEYFVQGFRSAMRISIEACAVATSLVMLMACIELVPQGSYKAVAFFGTGSIVLLWRSARKAWAVIRHDDEEKVTP